LSTKIGIKIVLCGRGVSIILGFWQDKMLLSTFGIFCILSGRLWQSLGQILRMLQHWLGSQSRQGQWRKADIYSEQ